MLGKCPSVVCGSLLQHRAAQVGLRHGVALGTGKEAHLHVVVACRRGYGKHHLVAFPRPRSRRREDGAEVGRSLVPGRTRGVGKAALPYRFRHERYGILVHCLAPEGEHIALALLYADVALRTVSHPVHTGKDVAAGCRLHRAAPHGWRAVHAARYLYALGRTIAAQRTARHIAPSVLLRQSRSCEHVASAHRLALHLKAYLAGRLLYLGGVLRQLGRGLDGYVGYGIVGGVGIGLRLVGGRLRIVGRGLGISRCGLRLVG